MTTDDVPRAVVTELRERPRWPLWIAGIGLACTLVPFQCSVNVSNTHYAWNRGGPLFGGVVAILFAAYALVRGARRGPLGARGKAALAMIALGSAAVIYGVLTIERIGGSSIDLQAPFERVIGQLSDDKIAGLIADAEPELQADAPKVRRLVHAFLAGVGPVTQIGTADAVVQGDVAEATGHVRCERGTLDVQVTFRLHGGTPHVVGLHITSTPDELPGDREGAEAVARSAVDAIAKGREAELEAVLDPRVDLPATLGDVVDKVHAAAGENGNVQLASAKACEGGWCFEYTITTPEGSIPVRFTLGSEFGAWLVSAFHIGS